MTVNVDVETQRMDGCRIDFEPYQLCFFCFIFEFFCCLRDDTIERARLCQVAHWRTSYLRGVFEYDIPDSLLEGISGVRLYVCTSRSYFVVVTHGKWLRTGQERRRASNI